MVVSRKASAAAPAPVSRTPSSQPIPRKQKQHQLQEQEIQLSPPKKNPPATSSSPNGVGSNKLRKPKPKSAEVKATRSTVSMTFLDKLFFFSLFAWALYAAVVCPQHAHDIDTSQTPVTCRALTSYRTHVLEPYILPPFKSAYNSPLVKPYTHKLEDAVHQVDGALRPWYQHAFLPRWRQHVVPRYRQAITFVEPRYHQAIRYVKQPLQPYLSQLEVHVSKIQKELHVYLNRLEALSSPYIVKARHSWSEVQPFVERAALATRRSLCNAWKAAKPHLITGAEKAQVYTKAGLKGAVEARRRYVDPHIKKILEQVDGNGKNTVAGITEEVVLTTVAPTEPETIATQPEPTPAESAEGEETQAIPTADVEIPDVVDTADSAPAATPPEAADEEYEEVTPEETSSLSVSTSSTIASTGVAPTPTPHQEEIEDDIRAVSVAEESARAAPSIVASDVEEALAAPTGPAKGLEEGVKGHLSGLGANAQKTPEVQEDLELDDFLSELGLEPEVPKPATVDAPAPAPTPEPEDGDEEQPVPSEEDNRTEEEKRKAAIAARRKDIVDRHDEWQRQLDELVVVQAKRVWVDIEGVRDWAVSELGDEFAPKVTEQRTKAAGLPETRYKRTSLAKGEGLGSKALEGLNKQGGRFLRGLETYLGSLEARKAGWKDKTPEELAQLLEKEREKWDEVLDKVEDRFGKMVRDVQGDIHTWYVGIRGREGDVIQEASEAIKKLAETAQADIAMDYAWLDDVTTKDWAKYHDLMTTYEGFQKTGYAIQNGSYVPSGIFTDSESTAAPARDVLVLALDNLQNEWNDVVLGFQLSVQNVKKRALELLSVAGPETEDTPDGTFRIKNEKGERVDDMREYLAQAQERLQAGMNEVAKESGTKEKEPEVSILPIGSGGTGQGAGGLGPQDGSRVAVGKDPVVVEENLKGVPVEHVEL